MRVRTSRATLRGAAYAFAVVLAAGVGALGCESGVLPSSTEVTGPLAAVGSLASTAMQPRTPSVAVGDTVHLKAIAYASGGVVVDTVTWTWWSIHPEIAKVDAKGVVTGVAPGGTTIKASTGGLTASAFVTVVAADTSSPPAAGPAPEPATVTLTPSASSVPVGTKVQLNATVKDSSGNVMSGEKVSWTSSAPAVAVVDTTGVVTTLAAGVAAITASSKTAQGQASVSATSSPPPAGTTGSVVFNAASRQQVITGWEATAQAGQGTALFSQYAAQLWAAGADLGITRLRVAVPAGLENPTGAGCNQYTVVNDDADPNHINPAGFNFTSLDNTIEQVVLPYRAKLASLGKQLYVNLNYTAFNKSCSNPAAVHQNPAEYAEFALAVFQHLQQKYGLVADSWEMILEAENNTAFTGNGALIGKALVATASRLAAAGFRPAFVAASTEIAGNAASYFDQIKSVAGAGALVKEISYHRYGTAPTNAVLQGIAQRAQSYGANTSMLEKIGANYDNLISDLLYARVSSWQQFTLGYPASDNGAQYFIIDSSTGAVTPGTRTRFLRQFFHYVEPGAYRVDATTSQGGITPLGFVNANGKAVVVVKTTAGNSFTISGLPPGTYGLRYTNSTVADAAAGSDQTIAAGQLIRATIPTAGLITIFAR